MSPRVGVFLDYQNVHLTAHGLFMPYGSPVYDALLHPVQLADRVVSKRRDGGELHIVRVFRGRPNPAHQPVPAAANDAQTAAWERDPRVEVISSARRTSRRSGTGPATCQRTDTGG